MIKEGVKLRKIYIDPTGGISGDIFSSSLISLGADKDKVISAMILAGEKLGKISIEAVLTDDNSTQLKIDIEPFQPHIKGENAKKKLDEIFAELNVDEYYRTYGFNVLNILIDAESKAHSENSFLTDHIHHNLEHSDHHHHHHEKGTYLHEAQDIIIDIVGAVIGMELLQLKTEVVMLSPLNVGGGIIKFSHGELSVPAPATKNILEKFDIKWQKGPIEKEICTPTGSAILAGLNPKYLPDNGDYSNDNYINGKSRGSRILKIPPFKIFIQKQEL